MLRAVAGLAVGVAGALAMARLIAGGGGWPAWTWLLVAAPLLAWIGYLGVRAHRGGLAGAPLAVAVGLGVAGSVLAWWGTLGPVLALVAGTAGFVLVRRYDRISRRGTELSR